MKNCQKKPKQEEEFLFKINQKSAEVSEQEAVQLMNENDHNPVLIPEGSQENIFKKEKSDNTKSIESEKVREFSPDQFKNTEVGDGPSLEKNNSTADPGSKTERFQ